jgi:hypothetical protein
VRVATAAGGAISATVALAACSALVQFHDESLGCDASACADGSLGDDVVVQPVPDAGPPDGSGLDAPGPEASPSTPDAAPDHYAPCEGLASGYYCANDGPNAYAGPASDLLRCVDGGIGKATPCDGGCLKLPDPFPDACNPCPGVPNGLYCGRDLAGFPSYNADFLVQCQNGDTVQQVACPHGCGSNGTMSACN